MEKNKLIEIFKKLPLEDPELTIDILDEIMSSLPTIKAAWGLLMARSRALMKRRIKRAVEFIEILRDNPNILIDEILNDEDFQDGVALWFEQYLIERSEEKRRVLKNIFLGFAKTEDKEDYPLEKFYHTVNQLSVSDIGVLKNIDVMSATGNNYRIYGNQAVSLTNIYNLINLGILIDVTGDRITEKPDSKPPYSVRIPFVRITEFGVAFIEFIKD